MAAATESQTVTSSTTTISTLFDSNKCTSFDKSSNQSGKLICGDGFEELEFNISEDEVITSSSSPSSSSSSLVGVEKSTFFNNDISLQQQRQKIEQQQFKKISGTQSSYVQVFGGNHSINKSSYSCNNSSAFFSRETATNDLFIIDPEQRRIRRLLAIFNLWRSKTEMHRQQEVQQQSCSSSSGNRSNGDEPPLTQQHFFDTTTTVSPLPTIAPPAPSISSSSSSSQSQSQSQSPTITATTTPTNSRTTSSTIRRALCNHYATATMRQPIMFVPTCASNVPFATNIAPLSLNNDQVNERKLWQSLVMPLVLGCIIFLIAVWTRQISLVLVNDTLVMVIILGAVFIIMSGVAFWLAKDQQTTTRENNQTQEEEEDQEQHNHERHTHHTHRLSSRNHSIREQQHHEPNCLNYRTTNSHNLSITNEQVTALGGGSSSRKCCATIAIIDCQPPDYYSAIQNSYPVNLFAATNQQQQQQQQQKQISINNNNTEINNNNNFAQDSDNNNKQQQQSSNIVKFLNVDANHDDEQHLDELQLSTSYNLPPSYEELNRTTNQR